MDITAFLHIYRYASLGLYQVAIIPKAKSVFEGEEDRLFVDQTLETIRRIASESFGKPMEMYGRGSVYRNLVDVDSLAILHSGNELVGFASGQHDINNGVFHLQGVAISSGFKGKGAGKGLASILWKKSGLSMLVLITQNPLMYLAAKSICRNIYPCHDQIGRPIPPQFVELASRLLGGAKLDKSTFVLRDFYRNCLYPCVPDCTFPEVNLWFHDSLEITGGLSNNAFLFVGDK